MPRRRIVAAASFASPLFLVVPIVKCAAHFILAPPLSLPPALLIKTAVVGEADERRDGSLPSLRTRLGDRARIYLSQALRVWFPHLRALVVTGAS